MDATKLCAICETVKPLSEFYKRTNRGVSGHQRMCKVCQKNVLADYRKDNVVKVSEYKKRYRAENRLSIATYHTDYYKRRLKEDTEFKIRHYLRNRLNKAIKRNSRKGSAVQDLGCSIPELKAYLESKFQFGMAWENHGEWHIDHIKPLALFDLSDESQLKQAVHYTNLQPLWATDNCSKKDKYNGCA